MGGYGVSNKRRGLDFWSWGFAIGSASFLLSFHITRFLLNIPFPISAAITLGVLTLFSFIGLFRINLAFERPSRSFLWAFVLSVLVLALFPGASWDQGHHIPAIRDILAGVHPIRAAEAVRPGVTGGFYHYGAEALAAVALFLSGGDIKIVLKVISLASGAVSFWLLYTIIRNFFSRSLGVVGTLIFFWSGNFFVLLNLRRLLSGAGWHDVPKLIFYGEFAKGACPFPGYFFHLFHPTTALGFPLFLLGLWLILRGGKLRAFLSGLLLGPLALANLSLALSAASVLFLYPFVKRIVLGKCEIADWSLWLAGGTVSVLLLGLPFLVLRNPGPGLVFGPFWTVTLELQHNIPLLVIAPVIFLGIPFILALPGFILAFRDSRTERRGLSMFLSLSIVGLLIPHILGTNDFVKLFMTGFLGYSPAVALVLVWLWRKGWIGRAAVILSAGGMALSPVAFYVFRWMSSMGSS